MCYFFEDINERDSVGNTILMTAVEDSNYGVVKMLLERGADPNISDMYGDSPLDIARYNANAGIVELLIAYGAKGKDGPSNKQLDKERALQG
jgi:uncharacterized protein